MAGSEAAWQIAEAGLPVVIHEMRPVRGTEAHHGGDFAELVCSNSFRSDDANGNAVGLLHQEMRTLGSLILRAADAHQVPAGGALAVDRDGFAEGVTAALAAGKPMLALCAAPLVLALAARDAGVQATLTFGNPEEGAALAKAARKAAKA